MVEGQGRLETRLLTPLPGGARPGTFPPRKLLGETDDGRPTTHQLDVPGTCYTTMNVSAPRQTVALPSQPHLPKKSTMG